MVFRLTITDEADKQLRSLPVREQRIIESAASTRLKDQPNILSKAVKRLRPNPFAEFELRIGNLRVLYNVEVESMEVVLVLVGRKVGSKLIVGGKEFHGHRDNPA